MSDPTATSSLKAQSVMAAPRGAILLLMLVYMVNMLDRQIFTILAEPVKNDLNLADWQIGAISGLAFALLYTAAGIPLSRIADRGDRVRMIAVAATVWSGFTMVCGLTRNFGEMLLARIGVGIGEAGCTPAAHSLISDIVPREKRASALAFYQLGTPLGALVGLVMGGVVLSLLSWRWAFFIAGAPGILLAVLVLFVLPEPRRAGLRQATAVVGVTWSEAIRALMTKKAFWCICAGSGFGAFTYFGQSAFLGSLYMRVHGAALADAAAQAGVAPTVMLGLLLGGMVGVVGGIGTLIGGWLADRAVQRGLRGYLTIIAVSIMISAPLYASAPLAGDMTLSLALLGGAIFVHSMTYGPVFAAIQTLAEPRMRGMAVALQILSVNGIGLALGPLFVGLISDMVGDVAGAASLQIAMGGAAFASATAAALFFLARRWVDGDNAH